MTRVAMHGAAGRMGLSITRILAETPDAKLVSAIDRGANVGRDVGLLAGIAANSVIVRDDVEAALEGVDVVIDFTHPTASVPLFEQLAARGVATVIGTTGFEAEGRAAIERLATKVPVVFAPNYSQGVTMLFALASRAASLLHRGFDAEIVEMHHRFKVDSPSGTAVKLAEVVAKARDLDYEKTKVHGRSGQVGARTDDEIGVLALRGGDIVGEHTLFLAGMGERIEISHRATDRQIFARGAVRAATWVVGKSPGIYDMFDVMGLERP